MFQLQLSKSGFPLTLVRFPLTSCCIPRIGNEGILCKGKETAENKLTGDFTFPKSLRFSGKLDTSSVTARL